MGRIAGTTKTLGVAGLACLAVAPAAAHAKAAPAYDAHSIIVKYADRATSAQRADAGRAAGVLQALGKVAGAGAQVVKVSGDPKQAAAKLNRSSSVLYAEPNYVYRATAIPNDPRFGELYGMTKIHAPEGWDTAGLGSFPTALNGAKIGFVDTGIDAAHEDFGPGKVADCGGVTSFGLILGLLANPTIAAGKCVDDNGHGTHVAGTAAATANNGRGVAGVSFNSPLAICKALNSSGSGPVAGVANCITWLAAHGAKIISMSLGGSASTTLQNAVAAASSTSLIVAAAGNSGDATLSYPAGYAQVVSVAATDSNDQKASFSTFNSDVEVAAPGVNILSTWDDGGYNTISGTSMATPHAAGVAAVIATRSPGGTPASWRAKLDASVDDLGAPGRDVNFGFGRVNLAKAATLP